LERYPWHPPSTIWRGSRLGWTCQRRTSGCDRTKAGRWQCSVQIGHSSVIAAPIFALRAAPTPPFRAGSWNRYDGDLKRRGR
jgi:hypothetical protein